MIPKPTIAAFAALVETLSQSVVKGCVKIRRKVHDEKMRKRKSMGERFAQLGISVDR
jgi:hypothetical protein